MQLALKLYYTPLDSPRITSLVPIKSYGILQIVKSRYSEIRGEQLIVAVLFILKFLWSKKYSRILHSCAAARVVMFMEIHGYESRAMKNIVEWPPLILNIDL